MVQRHRRGREARGVAKQAWWAWRQAAQRVDAAGQADAAAARLATAQQFSFWRSTGIDLRFELKTSDHEIHQVIPMVKDQIPR
jgi:hypothetical protein